MNNLDDETWPKQGEDYVDYDFFNVLSIKDEYLEVCMSGRFQTPISLKIKLDGHLFQCHDVKEEKELLEGMKLYDFLKELYDVDEEKLSKPFGKEWEFKYYSEKLALIVKKLSKKIQKQYDKDIEKRKKELMKKIKEQGYTKKELMKKIKEQGYATLEDGVDLDN